MSRRTPAAGSPSGCKYHRLRGTVIAVTDTALARSFFFSLQIDGDQTSLKGTMLRPRGSLKQSDYYERRRDARKALLPTSQLLITQPHKFRPLSMGGTFRSVRNNASLRRRRSLSFFFLPARLGNLLFFALRRGDTRFRQFQPTFLLEWLRSRV